MGALTLPREGVHVISGGPAPARATGRRGRVLRASALAGAAALAALVIVAMVVPAVRESHRKRCAENLDQLGRALHEHHRTHRQLPAPALRDRDGGAVLSWRVAILPQLGYTSLYERFHRDEPWDSPNNRALLAEMPPEFACPGGPAPRAGRTGYRVIVGPGTGPGSTNTPFGPTRGVDLEEITDGASNTLIVVETDVLVPWTKPEEISWAPAGPLPHLASPHPGGANVLFADGSTRFLKVTIASQVLLALLTINGGEVIPDG